MSNDDLIIEANWTGPYGWPHYENANRLPAVPKQPGVYLWTVEYQDGYLVYAAGITRRTLPQRFREHTHNYLNGEYTVLDIDAMKNGVRTEIWHGWGWTPEKRIEYEKRKTVIIDAANKQLAGFRVFAADVGIQPRILERLEASIMYSLYKLPPPFCTVPDKGMMLAPGWRSETPVIVLNKCSCHLFGIPDKLII